MSRRVAPRAVETRRQLSAAAKWSVLDGKGRISDHPPMPSNECKAPGKVEIITKTPLTRLEWRP